MTSRLLWSRQFLLSEKFLNIDKITVNMIILFQTTTGSHAYSHDILGNTTGKREEVGGDRRQTF